MCRSGKSRPIRAILTSVFFDQPNVPIVLNIKTCLRTLSYERGDIQLSRTSKIFEIHNEKVEKISIFVQQLPPKWEILKNLTFHDFTVAYSIENHRNSLKCHDFPDFAG